MLAGLSAALGAGLLWGLVFLTPLLLEQVRIVAQPRGDRQIGVARRRAGCGFGPRG